MPMKKIKVLLADDHPMLRSGLKNVLMSDSRFEIVSEVSRGDDAVKESFLKKPDIVIMDVNMPGLDGIEATKQIKTRCPEIKILILTMYSDEAYLKEGLRVGASGYILKRAADTELLMAIRSVLEGEKYIYPTLIPDLFSKPSETNQDQNKDPSEEVLSPREKEVLTFIALGHTQQEIAERLFVSIKTVESYKARIMEKLGASKRSDLVRYALRHNMITDKSL